MAGKVDQKLLRTTKFPPEFNERVDMQKVNVEVMKKWIASKISEVLGSEDDVVIEMCFNLLEGSRYPNIKVLQIQLGGFLEKDTAAFCKELWNLCLSAQSNPQGVPKELLEAKKLELIQEKIQAEKAAQAARSRREQERARERDTEDIRRRERDERGYGRGRGGRGGRDFDRRPPRRDSRSPPPYRRRDDAARPHPQPLKDSYIPANSPRNRERPRRPSPSYGSRSRSRSPPRRRQRRSPSRSRSRSKSRSRTPPRRRRSRSPDDQDRRSKKPRLSGGHKRGDSRTRNTSSDRSRSPTPRKHGHNRRKSASRSPSPHRRRSPRRHRSPLPRRSPVLERNGRLSRPPRQDAEHASPRHDDIDSSRADDRKGRNNRDRDSGKRRSSVSSSRSPEVHRRRRNTSSERSVTPDKKAPKAPKDADEEDEPGKMSPRSSQRAANIAREKALRESLHAAKRARSSGTDTLTTGRDT